MDAVFKEAEQLGLVLSEDTAQGVEDANDAFTRLRGLFRGTVLQITGAVAPALEALFTHLKNVKLEALEGTGGVEGFAKAIVEKFLSAVRSMIVGISQVHTAFNNLLFDLNVAIFDFRRIFGLDGLDESEQKIKEKIIAINNSLMAIEKFGEKKAGRAVDTLRALGLPTVEEAKAELLRLVAENEAVMARLQRPIRPDPPDYSEWLATFDRLIAGIEEKTDSVKSAMEEVTVTAQKPWYMPFINGVKMFGNSLDELVNEKLPDLKQMVDSFALQTMNNFTQAFVDGVTGAKSFGEAIRNLAKSVVDSLIKMLVQYYITKPLFDAISGGISSAFPTASGGGGGNTGNFAGSFSGGGFTGYGARAGGMDGKGGFPAILHPNESVIDHTRGQGAGVVVNQTINVTTGVQQTVRAEIANLLPQISNAAKAAVADSRMRGGGFSKAMVGA
jgi:hypothetical protein